MTKDELRKILKKHTLWLTGKDGGERAELSGASLSEADLSYADLSESNLSEADLSRANLFKADLSGANLWGANLRRADLSKAELSRANLYGTKLTNAGLWGANLRRADLHGADLTEADLTGADLRRADLTGADLSYANLSCANLGKAILSIDKKYTDEYTLFISSLCPEEGAFVGYKKAREKIVVLEITDDAKRSSATTYKCRCSKAKVLRIENLDGTPADVDSVASDYDKDFVYKVGEIVEVKDFDENRWKGCSRGIHFFISKEMARRYQ